MIAKVRRRLTSRTIPSELADGVLELVSSAELLIRLLSFAQLLRGNEKGLHLCNPIYLVARGGIEPPTQGFSILCSTDCATRPNFSNTTLHPVRGFWFRPLGFCQA